MENVLYEHGSPCQSWNDRIFHSADKEIGTSHHQISLLRSVSDGTGSPSGWKSGMNSPVNSI